MNKVEEYNLGRKRIIEIELADGSVKKLQITKSTKIENELTPGNSLYIEPNKDGTYRLAHGSKIFENLDDVVSIKIVREDFK